MHRYPRWPIHLALGIACFVMLVPIYWVLKTSITGENIFNYPPALVPRDPQPFFYVDAWYAIPFPYFFMNSVLVALMVILANLMFNAAAGYALTRSFAGKRWIVQKGCEGRDGPGDLSGGAWLRLVAERRDVGVISQGPKVGVRPGQRVRQAVTRFVAEQFPHSWENCVLQSIPRVAVLGVTDGRQRDESVNSFRLRERQLFDSPERDNRIGPVAVQPPFVDVRRRDPAPRVEVASREVWKPPRRMPARLERERGGHTFAPGK